MVGRLVEQQQLRCLDQPARQQHAALLSRGQRGKLLVHRQPHLLQQPLHAVVTFPVVVLLVSATVALDHRPHRAGQAARHFLPQRREHGAWLAEHLPVVGLQLARNDLHQGGLAGAVAADEGHAFPAVNLEIDPVEQRRATEAQADIKKTDNGHGNRSAWTTTLRQRKAFVATSAH